MLRSYTARSGYPILTTAKYTATRHNRFHGVVADVLNVVRYVRDVYEIDGKDKNKKTIKSEQSSNDRTTRTYGYMPIPMDTPSCNNTNFICHCFIIKTNVLRSFIRTTLNFLV